MAQVRRVALAVCFQRMCLRYYTGYYTGYYILLFLCIEKKRKVGSVQSVACWVDRNLRRYSWLHFSPLCISINFINQQLTSEELHMYGNMSMFGLIFSLMLLGTARCLQFPGDRGDLLQRYGVLKNHSSNAGRHLAFTLPSVCNYSCLKTEFSSDLSVCLSPMFYFMALLVCRNICHCHILVSPQH